MLTNKSHYAQSESAARMRHPTQCPPHFNAFGMMAQMAVMEGGNFAIELPGMMQPDGDVSGGDVGYAMLQASDGE